jgi:outer membrane protein assembly factor BamB
MARTRRGIRSLVPLVALCSVLAGSTITAGATVARGTSQPRARGVAVGWGLDGPTAVAGRYALSTPDAIAAIDGRVWVANEGNPSKIGDTLVAFNAATGSFVRQVKSLTLAAPRVLTACGGHLWLGTGYGSVVELDGSTGRVLRTLVARNLRIASVQSFTCSGKDLWVVHTSLRRRHNSTTVHEYSATNAVLVRTLAIPGSPSEFANEIAVVNGEVWVTSSGTDAATVLDESTGAIVRTYPSAGALEGAGAEFVHGADLFVAVFHAVVELDASSGAVVRVLRSAAYRLDLPVAFVADGQDLYVVNTTNSVTELSMRTGALLHVFRGTRYHFDDPVCATRAGANLWIANALGQSITEFAAR